MQHIHYTKIHWMNEFCNIGSDYHTSYIQLLMVPVVRLYPDHINALNLHRSIENRTLMKR